MEEAQIQIVLKLLKKNYNLLPVLHSYIALFALIPTHTHVERERERERERAYELNIFHETLLRISASNKFKEQHSKTVNITFLSECLCGYILRIKIPKSTPYINCVFVHHLFSWKPKISNLLDPAQQATTI